MSSYNYIIPKFLAQGAAPTEQSNLSNFDVLVLTAMEYQPPSSRFRVKTVLHVPLNDDGTPITKEECKLAILASKDVTRRLRKGERVLTTCAMGLNRSGLVNALVLLNLGYSAREAIALIKRRRGDATLSNAYFRSVIRTLHSRGYGRQTQHTV